MMFVINALTTALAFLSLAHATPVSRRDVIAPKIISPDASSVWTVGSVETVTWDISNLPPDSQITNPIGKIILGYDEDNSLNLDFEHPLAADFKLRDGSVKLTVPDVPPRDDYLIVLFGDSGNTSPSFAIARIANGGAANLPPPGSSTLITTPIPITGSTITGGVSTTTATTTSGSSSSTTTSTATTPTISNTSSTTTSSSSTTTGVPSANQTSSALSVSRGGNAWSLKALTACIALSALLVIA